MSKTIFLSIFIHGVVSQFVKYGYYQSGQIVPVWNIADHRDRPCRAEDGWHRCADISRVDVCVMKSYASSFCPSYVTMECNDDEMLMQITYYNGTAQTCIPRWDIRGKRRYHDYREAYLPCHQNEFECEHSQRCIPRHFVQDGYDDCDVSSGPSTIVSDQSDEVDLLPNCFSENEFRCNGSRCIPRNWVMNGKEDCRDGEDEMTTLKCNNQTEFQCTESNRCILRRYVNDGFNDCPSNNDESVTNFACIDQLEFSCEKHEEIGRCIPREWVGNGVKDCSNGEDESVSVIKCVEGELACLDKGRCLSSKYIGDGIQHCGDGSDEVELCTLPTMYRYKPQKLIPWSFLLYESNSTILKYYPDFQPQYDLVFGFKCFVNRIINGIIQVSAEHRMVPQFYLTNNKSVCSANEDSCFDGQEFTCARCLDRTIISKSQVCDNVIDCVDISDECLCKNSQVEELCGNVFSFQSQAEEDMITIDMICNGNDDLKDGIDEQYCNKQVLSTNNLFRSGGINDAGNFTCTIDQIEFPSISIDQTNDVFCNGHFDCPLKEDECSSECLQAVGRSVDVKKCFPFVSGPFVEPWNYGVRDVYYFTVLITDSGHEELYTSSSANDQEKGSTPGIICEYKMIEPNPLVVSYKHRSIPSGNKMCTEHDELVIHDDFNFLCDIHGVSCPWFHYCDSDETSKIEISRRCDYIIDCADKSDEENCSSETHFYCKNGNPFFIPRSKVGDGLSDCSDRSDEAVETAFSSGTEMLKSTFLRYFVWLCAFAMILFNGIVLRKHFRKLEKIQSKNSATYCNVYLLIILALSDTLFGFVLLTIGIKSQQFAGKYYEFDLEWRSSLTCNMIGIFTVISSQTSMNLLVLMTGLRLYITYNPYMTKLINFKILVIFSFVCLGISIFLASFPVWGNSNFINFFYTKNNLFFDSDLVTPSRVEDYMEKTEIIALLTNFSCNVTQGGLESPFAQKLDSWFFNSEEGRKDFPNRQIDIMGKLGFYSSSSVCFPDYFSKTSPASLYGLIIIFYNFFALLAISLGYILIFHRARRSTITVQTADEERANTKMRKMMTRILLIVATDMICWLPIIIMSIYSYLGHDLPDSAHPLSAILFLPINSLINPMIYSGLDKIVTRKLKKLFSSLWRICCGKEGEFREVEQPPIPMQAIRYQKSGRSSLKY